MPVIQRLATGGARGFGLGSFVGANYESAVAETASGVDLITTGSSLFGVIGESATGADSVSSIPIYTGAVAESASSADTTEGSVISVPTGYASFDFNGSAYVDTPVSSVFATGNNDWTLQFFLYLRSTPTSNTTVFDVGANIVSYGWRVEVTTARQIRLVGLSTTSSTAAINLNQWYFITISRYSSPGVYLFVNSTRTTSSTTNLGNLATNTYCRIGGAQNNSTRINALISNLQFRNNISVSSVTVPTTPLTNDANTLLLTCQNITVVDNSTANSGGPWTLTNSGTTTTSTNPL